MSRIHVCHLITRLNPGGAQHNVFDLLVGCDKQIFTSSLIAGPGGGLDDLARSLPDASVHFVQQLVRPVRPSSDLRAFARCRTLMRQIRPDIVHTHGPKAGVIGRWAAFSSGVPVRLHTYHGLQVYPSQALAERMVTLFAERSTRPITSHVVTVTEHDRVAGGRLRLFSLGRSSVIRNGVDLASFRTVSGSSSLSARRRRRRKLKRHLEIDPRIPLVTMVGYLRAIKAPERFLRLARLVSDAVPHVRFWLVGDGELRGSLERLRHALRLDGTVEMPGNRFDIPQIWGATDVAVLTSHSEGFPRTLIEAMASGVPIVASDLPGIREVVRDSVTGYLEPPGQVAAMAKHVIDLLRNPTGAALMGQRGVMTVETLDVRRTVEQYESLYRRLWRSESADRKV